MHSERRRAWPVGIVAALAVLASSSAAELPPEGRCPDVAGISPSGAARDAAAPRLREGASLELADLPALASLFPVEVWLHRRAFFHEGMRMEVGACHRRYPVSSFYRAAGARYASRVSLDGEGNLAGYVAGLPFPPEAIDPRDRTAATRWAWNLQHRYRGAGPSGSFRIVDLAGRAGAPETYLGSFFYFRTGHRADLQASDYWVPEAKRSLWVAGGRFEQPFRARHLAWRQIRSKEANRAYREPDDTFVYVPALRKPRRAATAWVDGLFTPRYRAGREGGGGVPFGVGGTEGLESIQPTSGLSAATTEHLRRGFAGLALRPNAYEWILVGERQVLAPLNGRAEGFPLDPGRNFGPTGLSLASDRWDVRYAVVIEGRARRPVDEVARAQIWLDYQTQQPLYLVTRRGNGLLLEVGILVHRFSGDRSGYPRWPGGHAANVFDPVAASFYSVAGGGSGWRRESYDARSLPADPAERRRRISTDSLIRGR